MWYSYREIISVFCDFGVSGSDWGSVRESGETLGSLWGRLWEAFGRLWEALGRLWGGRREEEKKRRKKKRRKTRPTIRTNNTCV